jgi:hypothetical protein
MHKTRLSLWYLFSYLVFGGAGFLLAPGPVLVMFQSTGEYGFPMVRLAGVLLLGLAIIVFQVIRHRVEILYPTTLAVRLVILAVLAGLYWSSRDPLFLILFGIVGLGVCLTGWNYLSERSAAR